MKKLQEITVVKQYVKWDGGVEDKCTLVTVFSNGAIGYEDITPEQAAELHAQLR